MLKYFFIFVSNFAWVGFVLSDTSSYLIFYDPTDFVHASVTKM